MCRVGLVALVLGATACGSPNGLPPGTSGLVDAPSDTNVAFDANADAAGSASVYIVPVSLGSPSPQLNSPSVAVTVCIPGTDQCVTVPNVTVDTGSVGLRIFASSLEGLTLPTQTLPNGEALGECIAWSPSYWGPVQQADVKLGGATAQNVEIQVVDPTFRHLPVDCPGPVDSASAGYDGILGIGSRTTDCPADGTCDWPDWKYYFECNATVCGHANPPAALLLPNVLAAMPTANNGVTLTLPTIDQDGAESVQGELILGIGTNAQNTPTSAAHVVVTDDYNNVPVQASGMTFTGGYDTGTAWTNLPLATIATCSDYPTLFCPPATTTVTVTVLSNSGAGLQDSTTVTVANYDQLPQGNLVFDDIAGMGSLTDPLLFGMPFYLGRTVYTGFVGRSSPLGTGPYVAHE